jgi:hypothetical protein
MTNSFKRILLKIAGLSEKNQCWLLEQLNPEQQKRFVQHRGLSLLDEARHFAHVVPPERASEPEPEVEGNYPDLGVYSPLFVAIILEQGEFSWTERFLNQYQHSLPNATHLKEATKQALFQEWQKTRSFAEQLEMSDGTSI